MQDRFHFLMKKLKKTNLKEKFPRIIVDLIFKDSTIFLLFSIFILLVFRFLAIDAIRAESVRVAMDLQLFCNCRMLIE